MKNRCIVTLGLVWCINAFTTANALEKEVAMKPAARIVALAPHIVENLFVIGAGDRIVGTVDYADYPEAALGIPRIGGYHGIQLEKLLALEPDLVIAWQTGNKKDDLAKIESLGIPVMYSNATSLEAVSEEIRRFGQLTGLIENANLVAMKFDEKLKILKAHYRSSSSLRAFYQLWPDPMMSVNRKTWIHELMTLCHVENVFAQASNEYPQISLENVLHAKPDVIIVPHEKTKKQVDFIDWSVWPEIPAGKFDQVVDVDADLLHRYTTRVLDGVEEMCDKLNASREFYQQRK
ncbi:cobalamin-binding protein [Pseudoalteromonas xiamenensis]|uniref:cobalamin-binding protein n=1 Tax=Pseudoalteromonas xiamenensis TaxID=882626 RepID=UPI0027E524BB|nr:cobalamin-binding protein [Pseudoalteromonas xiamenensis]WMN59192.1 cobalamin-binding protein [Pseudoalteromonas xiamenensis]